MKKLSFLFLLFLFGCQSELNNNNHENNISRNEYENISSERAKNLFLQYHQQKENNIILNKNYCIDAVEKIPNQLKQIASIGYSKAKIWLIKDHHNIDLDKKIHIDNSILLNKYCSDELNNEILNLEGSGFIISKNFNIYEIQLANKKTEKNDIEIEKITLFREDDIIDFYELFKEPLNNVATNNNEKITPIITQKLFDDASIKIKQLNNKICEREINYIDKAIYLNSKGGFSSLHIELTNELGFRFNNNYYFYISIPTYCELHLKNKISQLSNFGFEITYPQIYYDLFGKENTYRISWL